MDSQPVQLFDLPDELLLIILLKLNPIDVLYLLFGLNKRLNKIVLNAARTTKLSLMALSSTVRVSSMDEKMLDRFCSFILPRIHQKIQLLHLEQSSFERILLACNYSNLRTIFIYDFRPELIIRYFTDGSPIARLFKEQIQFLILVMPCSNKKKALSNELFADTYARIFDFCTSLVYFDFNSLNKNAHARLSLCNRPPTTCFSSSLILLYANVSTFDDCLCLLDGRLNRLTRLIVNIRSINTSTFNIDNTKVLPNLTLFSLTCYSQTSVYDDRIPSLLRRMANLKNLTLCLAVKDRFEFIDGTHLNNEILIHLPQLNTFIFHIRTTILISEGDHLKSVDDIQKTFINSKLNQVKCYVDYFNYRVGQCHIYSQPFIMTCLNSVTNCFQGDRYTSVTELNVYDVLPFEDEFFVWISRGFPSLKYLTVRNLVSRKHKRSITTNDCRSTSSSISFSRLISLDIFHSHIDYAELFLRNTNIHLPKLTELYIDYERLLTVTDNFSNETTRAKCARLLMLHIQEDIVYPKDFYSYFSSLDS